MAKLAATLSGWQAGSLYGTDMLYKEMIHTLGREERNCTRFYHDTQNIMQFKTRELFISGIFHSVLLDDSWLWVAETVQAKPPIRGTAVFPSEIVFTGAAG